MLEPTRTLHATDLVGTGGVGRIAPRWRSAGVIALLVLLFGVLLFQLVADGGSSVRRTIRSGAVTVGGLSSLPLAAQGPISAAVGADERVLRLSPSAGGFRAINPAQRLSMHFGRSGALVSSGAARLGLSLLGVGYGASVTTSPLAALHGRTNRIVYMRRALKEWYVNGVLGLEQGFTVEAAHTTPAADPFTLSLALSGNMHPSLVNNDQSVIFTRAGSTPLRYGDLSATDARGSTGTTTSGYTAPASGSRQSSTRTQETDRPLNKNCLQDSRSDSSISAWATPTGRSATGCRRKTASRARSCAASCKSWACSARPDMSICRGRW